MNLSTATFADYQARYEGASFVDDVHEEMCVGFYYLQAKVHQISSYIDAVRQLPEFTLKITEFSLEILAYHPLLKEGLAFPKQVCREIKNFTRFAKGIKSIDHLLHLTLSWKKVILTVSGLTLFILSGMTLVDRFKILNISAVKVGLASIPILGTLPFGGLISLSSLGLSSMLLLLSFDKQKNLKKMEIELKNKKWIFWSQPLDLPKVQFKKDKYERKVAELKKVSDIYNQLLDDGYMMYQRIPKRQGNYWRKQACRRAIQELEFQKQEHEKIVSHYQSKYSYWDSLEKSWDYIDVKEVEKFRRIHQRKCESQLKKVNLEKRKILLSKVKYASNAIRHILMIGAVVSGYGLVSLPVVGALVGLEVVGLGSEMINFKTKKSIQQLKTPPINLIDHITLLLEESNDSDDDDISQDVVQIDGVDYHFYD